MKMINTYSNTCKFLFLFSLVLVFAGCKDDFKPEASFIKVYDDQDLSKDYFPISIERTSDNGYLTLSAFNGSQIHILKADAVGNLLWEFDLPSNYISAAPNLIERNGDLHLVCMDAVGLFTYIMKVDEAAQSAVEFQVYPEILYPLCAADNGNEVYIQNYERIPEETGVFELNGSMDQIQDSTSVKIFVDIEGIITDHLNYTGKRFPFFLSMTPENDYLVMNGFNNYSFSTVFLDDDLEFSGVYSGAAFDGGLSAIEPLGGNKFALARFSFDDIYINPSADLSPTTIDIAEAIPSEWQSELDAENPILIKNISINNVDYAVYLSTTKSNQLILSFFSTTTGELAGTKYLGESVPLKACDFIKTEDEGLMILTQATIMSSFKRIATIKLSKEELESLLE